MTDMKLNLQRASKRNKIIALLIALAVVVVGATLIITRATGPFASLEPEKSTISGNAAVVTDSAASGGQALKFQAPAPVGAGCPAYPAFPDASCTGWQHTGVTLKAVPSQVSSGTGWHWETGGYVLIDGAGAVLDGLDIDGCVNVENDNVTIQRSRVRCGDYYVIRNFSGDIHYKNLKVVDTEIDGLNDLSGSAGISFENYTATRLNVHNISSLAFHVEDNVTVEDSYIHDFACGYASGSNLILHQAGMGTNGGGSNMVMRHNNIDLPLVLYKGEGCISGGIANYHDFGTFDHMLIDKNLINVGSGYCLKAGVEQAGKPYPNSTYVTVTNNVFGRKYNPECGEVDGQGATVSNWADGPTNVWSGNTWGSGTAATSLHKVGDTVNP